MFEYIAYAFAGVAFLTILLFYIYNLTASKKICICIFVILAGTYNLSILPGGIELRAYSFIIYAPLFVPFLIDFFRPEKYLLVSEVKAHHIHILLRLMVLAFFISVFLVNISDLKSFAGISKAVVILGGSIFYLRYLPEEIERNPSVWNVLLKFMVIFGVLTAVFAILFYVLGYNVNPAAPGASSSYFKHPNTSAFVYSLSAPIIVYFLLFEKEYISDVLFWALLAGSFIVYIAMLLTMSRAGYIAILSSSAILLFLKNKKLFYLWLLMVAIAVVFFLQPFLFGKGSASSISRLGLLYSAIEMLKSSNIKFLFGFGIISVFEEFTNFKLQLGPLLEDVAYPHNSILFFIMQFGLIAFIPTLIFLSYLLLRSVRLLKSDLEGNRQFIIPFTVVVSILFQSLLEDTVLFPEFFVFHVFMIFLGFLFYGAFPEVRRNQSEAGLSANNLDTDSSRELVRN